MAQDVQDVVGAGVRVNAAGDAAGASSRGGQRSPTATSSSYVVENQAVSARVDRRYVSTARMNPNTVVTSWGRPGANPRGCPYAACLVGTPSLTVVGLLISL